MAWTGPGSQPPPRVAFGPEVSGFGSWPWVGDDIRRLLEGPFETSTYRPWEVPEADAVVVVKHAPPRDWAERVARRAALVYAPVDFYPGPAEIDADAPTLRRCARIVVHCERLRRYFAPYAPVAYMDHHVKFAPTPRGDFRDAGDILWVGVRSNLPPLVEWVNGHPLPRPLDVLTNPERPGCVPAPAELGFRAGVPVRVHEWSPARHVEMAASARAALDVKGADFRARHKPPAKGIDFVASGLPLAMDRGSGTAEHLARMGFELADPLDVEHWLSRGYWEETRRFGLALRELLAPTRVARRVKLILDEVLASHTPGRHNPPPAGLPPPPVK